MMLTALVVVALQAPSLPVPPMVKDGSRKPPATASAAKPRETAKRHETAGPRVVIDAGHGGRDPGAPMRSNSRIREKDITLQVALKVGEILRNRGVDVFFTRTTDTLIALDDRGHIANQAKGDVFISIHVNAANPAWKDPAAARGFETYFLAAARTEDARRVEEMENEAVRFESEGTVPLGDPLSFILSDMMQNEHLRESSDLAGIVQEHLKVVHPGPNRGVKQAGFRVLVNAFMPAILVELGFGTNAAEAEFLSSSNRQRELARAVGNATIEYLERYQRRVGGGTASAAHD